MAESKITSSPGKAFPGGLRLGRVSGIDIVAHWSLLFIFGLILLSLGAGVFPSWHPDWGPALTWGVALLAATLFFVSVAAHELAHALVGRAQGVPIERITLFLFGGLAHMTRHPESAKAELLMALAGPLTSLLIGLVALLTGSALAMDAFELAGGDPALALTMVGPGTSLLLWLGPVNIALAIFNMIPGFPLDGGRVLRAVLWWITKDLEKATRYAAASGQVFGWLLIVCGLLMVFGYRVPFFGTGVSSGLWLALIGWFLNNAARMGYEQVLIRETLQGVPVGALMYSRIETVPSDLPVSALVNDFIMRHDQRAFPVVDGGELRGLVCLENVRAVPREQWSSHRVADIMTPTQDLEILSPYDPAMEAFQRLGSRSINQIPVLEGNELRGMVRREDILKWLSLHGSPV